MHREDLTPRRCALAGLGLLLTACAAAPPAGAPAQGVTEPVRLPAVLPPRPRGVVETGARYREFAGRLDTETRRLLKTAGAARRDGFLYGMDVAPLLLYAAERGDAALYQQLMPAARKLIVTGPEDSFARGFVLWRQKDGAKPEVSGAAETVWMAHALWAGAQAFQRDEDRALALQVLDGYARHAYELQQVWLVRKYFAFSGRTFATYSMLPGYQPDFLAEAEAAHGRSAWQGFAERSYALLERAVSPSGLLYPVIQPEIGATYPALGLDVYGPNNVVALADSCEAADAALRGLPGLARGVLDVAKGARPNRFDRLHAYYDGASGKAVGEVALSSAAYACLGRLAAAFGDQDAWERFEPRLQADMDPAPTVALSQDAPLYAAGPQLRTALAAGVFKP